MWSEIVDVGAFLLHHLTGWIVHPGKGCCSPEAKKMSDLFEEKTEKSKK